MKNPLQLATSAYRRDTGNLPDLPLKNMIAETAGESVILQSRPGLKALYTAGPGPVHGLFSKDGVFGGAMFSVSGNLLFLGQNLLDPIDGTGAVSWAAAGSQLAVTRGRSLWLFDGVNVDKVVFPDGAWVRCIETLGSYFYGVRDDTHRIYFSTLLDGSEWQALDYISAERKPDPIYDLLVLGEEMVALGSESVEFFQETGDGDAPVARAAGRVLGVGVRGSGCSAVVDNALVWIANDNSVRTYDGTARRLSDASIDEQIKNSTSVSGFGWSWEGHVLFAVRLDTKTLVVDAATGSWSEMGSLGYDNFRAKCAAMDGGSVRFGDNESGTVCEWSGWDELGGVLERVFSGATRLNEPLTVDNVMVEANVGYTGLLAGQGSEPALEMSASRDGGATYGPWRSASLGRQGKYRTRTRINRWGLFDTPGMIIKGRVTDPVPLRVSAMGVNEPGGGRARG
jgi:hypothetical protein